MGDWGLGLGCLGGLGFCLFVCYYCRRVGLCAYALLEEL